jgi:FlaA1/EpsC-like NDP-sugar epimerase
MGTLGLTATHLSAARLPYSALVIDALLALCVLAGPRLFVRFAGARTRGLTGGRRAIVVGAGAAGELMLREIRLDDRLHVDVVAFVDDDPHKQKQLLGNVPVMGTIRDLPSLIGRLGANELIIAMPNARGAVIRKILLAATDAGIPARTVPGLNDLLSGRVKVSALRPVEIQDILRREPVVTDLQSVRELATGRTVLVTGAGGSIGGELCRQIAALEPSALVALDHSENQVFEVESELRRLFPRLHVVPIVADIRSAARIHDIVGRYAPHAIFHAAAHKHVPLMERNVAEAITNNVLGTRNVVDAALDTSTRHFVNVSTDKAVRPTSIMGATKRIAEQIVLSAALAEGRNFVSVRFGNVLGSRGSVVPIFLRQIEEGGPITITHPEMHRYFMTIPEAVQLLLQAGALGSGGELFVLDMGAPVKITDLARDLIRLSGLEEDADIELAFTGVRPGEKLFEEVFFGGENIIPTNHPKVLRFAGESIEPAFADRVDALIRRAAAQPVNDDDLRQLIHAIVPEFTGGETATNGVPAPLLHRHGSPPIERTDQR